MVQYTSAHPLADPPGKSHDPLAVADFSTPTHWPHFGHRRRIGRALDLLGEVLVFSAAAEGCEARRDEGAGPGEGASQDWTVGKK